MTKLIKNIIRGAGSVVEIAPHREKGSIKAGRFYSAKNDGHSIGKDWIRVGQDIKTAVSKEHSAYDKAAAK